MSQNLTLPSTYKRKWHNQRLLQFNKIKKCDNVQACTDVNMAVKLQNKKRSSYLVKSIVQHTMHTLDGVMLWPKKSLNYIKIWKGTRHTRKSFGERLQVTRDPQQASDCSDQQAHRRGAAPTYCQWMAYALVTRNHGTCPEPVALCNKRYSSGKQK